MLNESDLKYFQKRKMKIPSFWHRLGGQPSMKGMKVLDLGCGFGSLSIDIACKGAKKVVGIDLDRNKINFAKKNILINYPQLINNIEFYCCDISELKEDDNDFDMMVSQAAFEHIISLEDVLAEMRNRLKVGGKMYVGFGPLYNSPYGSHRTISKIFFYIPWGHLMLPESLIIRSINNKVEKEVSSISDMGLNKLSFEQYKALLHNCELKVLYFKVNASNNPISILFSLLRQVPFLEEYFSHNIYCILEKDYSETN